MHIFMQIWFKTQLYNLFINFVIWFTFFSNYRGRRYEQLLLKTLVCNFHFFLFRIKIAANLKSFQNKQIVETFYQIHMQKYYYILIICLFTLMCINKLKIINCYFSQNKLFLMRIYRLCYSRCADVLKS